MDVAVHYGTTTINYTVEYSDRRTLAIEVHPDLSVKVIAPKGVDNDEISRHVLRRARWIKKHQRYFEEFLPRTPRREYVSGESHYYLGRRYLLRVRKSAKRSVRLIGPDLIVSLEDPNDVGSIKSLIATWYYTHAQKKFQQALTDSLSKFKRYKMKVPPMTIRRMPKRWGSCTSSGKIILNPEIIKSPSKCIEYVVTHELCHLVHPNHGAAFHQLQDKAMPEWKRWKVRLERTLS